MDKKPLKLNIGCGEDYKEGYINIDVTKNVKLDVYVKNENEINYKDVDEILASRMLPYLKDEVKTICKWHKMLKLGGILKIIVPHYSSAPYAMQAKRHIGYRILEFYFFEPKHRTKWVQIPKEVRFKVNIKIKLYKGIQFWNYFLEPLINLHLRTLRIYEKSFLHNLSPAACMEVKMVKI